MTTRAHLTPRLVCWTIAAAFTVLTVRLGLFVDRYAVNILFWDQWDFLNGLFDGADAWTLFTWQHGPQRQGLGNLITAAVYSATGWNNRADAAVTAVVMLLAGLAALWLVRRVCGALRAWDMVVPLLFLTTTNAESYTLAPNLAHGPLPALYLIAYALALTVHPHALRTALLVGINFLAVFSGFTLLLGGMTTALLLLCAFRPRLTIRDRTTCVAGVVASVGTLVLYFHDYAFLPAVDCFVFPHVRPWEYLPFSGFVLLRPFAVYARASPWHLMLGTAATLAMSGFVAIATVRLLRLRGDSVFWSVLWTLAGFTMVFAIASAVGRVCNGMANASASRYIPYVLPGLLAVHLALRSGLPTPRTSTALLALLLAACLGKERASITTFEAMTYSAYKRQWHDCYLRLHNIGACDVEADSPLHPAPEATHLQQKLDWLEARGYSLFQDGERLLESARPE